MKRLRFNIRTLMIATALVAFTLVALTWLEGNIRLLGLLLAVSALVTTPVFALQMADWADKRQKPRS